MFFFMILKFFFHNFSYDVGDGFIFTINFFNYIFECFNEKCVSPFVREVAGVNSLCCVEVFVALSSIDGFIQ